MTIRPIGPSDLPFLRRMLYAAVFWRPPSSSRALRLFRSARRPLVKLLLRRYLAQYHAGWGRAGDTGFIAEMDGSPVGAVWYRFFTEAEHGEGYVDGVTPELAIAVVQGYRGRGIGRALLERIADQARRDGVGRISLSVEPDNYAKRLYESVGYREYEAEDAKGRMVLELRAAPDPGASRI